MGKRPIPLDKDLVISLYVGGETTVSLAARFGCSRPPIEKVLHAAGVMRNIGQDNARRYLTMGERERKLQVKAANKAARGRVVSQEESVKRAKSKEGTFRSQNERAVSAALLRLGIEHVPQVAIGGFNGDIGVAAHMLMVELDGGEWHGSTEKAAADRKQATFVTSEGWRIVRYRGRALQYPELIALDIKRICADPSPFGRERMIRRHVKDLLRVANHQQAATVMRQDHVRDRVAAAIVREDAIADSH